MKKPITQSIVYIIALTALLFPNHLSGQQTENDTVQKVKRFYRIERPWPVSKYSARVGGFWAISSTKAGLGTDSNPHSIVDLENDLGMNRHTASMLFNVNARFGKHHRVDLSYYYLNRNSNATIDKEISFGGNTYPINAQINNYLNTSIIRFSYGFAFFSNSRFEAGAMIGAHIMMFKMGMEAVGNSQQLDLQDRSDFTAPLPDLGIWTTYAFHPKWALGLEFGYFGVKIDNIKGELLTGSLNLQRRFGDHISAELGYTFFDVNVDLNRPNLTGDFDWSYNGPSLTAVYRF